MILYSEPSTSMKKLQDHLKKDMKMKYTNFKQRLTAGPPKTGAKRKKLSS